MSEQTDNLLNLIKPYGLSDKEGKIYLYLLQNGFAAVLQISRSLHIPRTQVYRLLDKLIVKELVEQRLDSRGLKFGATHPGKFQQIVSEKKQKAEHLNASLPILLSELNNLSRKALTSSKVLYYKGIEGLKQVSYNITKAEKLLRVFEMEHLSDFLPADFAEMVREKLVENKVSTYDLTNKKSFPGFTKVTGMIKKYSQFRYIDPNQLQIKFEVLIYNNVYATYNYKEGKDIFCVEIYNDQLAKMQKQVFDFIWLKAQKMKFKDEFGAAGIEF